ncbi:MAG: hypothetical protein IPJ85_14850 [Flavobacteriales bacterium]|nr:hypothetical protein [Flavobacteriales bacterium]
MFITSRDAAKGKSRLHVYKVDEPFEPNSVGLVEQASFAKNERADFLLDQSAADKQLLKKIQSQSKPLSTTCGAYFGIRPGTERSTLQTAS